MLSWEIFGKCKLAFVLPTVNALMQLCKAMPPFSRYILEPEIHLTNKVQANNIYVVGIKNRDNVVPTLMSLYSSEGEYPFFKTKKNRTNLSGLSFI